MQSSFSFYALKKLGAGTFRIVWIGNIIRGTTADGITVVFAPFGISKSTGEEISDLSKRVSIVLPVAYLRKFRIGDIWENGKWTGRRDIQTQETFRLTIFENSVAVMPVGVPLNDDRINPHYLLPFSDFEGHREHTHAQCARITLENGATLVVPCMELVRFYFGASGSFLKRLFSGAFALDRLYCDARLNSKSRTASVELAPDLSGIAATTVARIAFCKQARSAARWIVNSGVATAANRLTYYPKTTFPFYGTTDLTAYGRWICHGDSRIFLAEQLSRCTHPFPFDTLFYSTSRSLVKPGVGYKEQTPAPSVIDPEEPRAMQPEIHLSDAPTSNFQQNMGLPADNEGNLCFPDLANKIIRRVGKSKSTGGTAKTAVSETELGVGTETSSSALRGAELAIDLDEVSLNGLPPPDAAEVMLRAVSANAASRPGYMAWKPILAQEAGKGSGSNAFVRGDAILKDQSIKRLQNIWAGVLEVTVGPIVTPVLVLVRDNITEDADDHIVLLRLDPGLISEEIDKYCCSFATGKQSEAFAANVLEVIESERATDLLGILRRLSMILPSLLQLSSIESPQQGSLAL